MGPLHVFPVEQDDLIEYTDDADRPLLLAPRSAARRLGLTHRVAGVVLRDARRRVCVRRRGAVDGPRRWDLSAIAHVRRGEAREDAARRALETETGIREAVLIELAAFVPADAEESVRVTLFSARSARELPDPERTGEYMFLDADELEGLAGQMPELLTPALLWAVRSGSLWTPGTSRRKACPGNAPARRE